MTSHLISPREQSVLRKRIFRAVRIRMMSWCLCLFLRLPLLKVLSSQVGSVSMPRSGYSPGLHTALQSSVSTLPGLKHGAKGCTLPQLACLSDVSSWVVLFLCISSTEFCCGLL